MGDAKESIASLTTDIEALTAGLKALDKSTAEATEQRKEENSDFTELMAQDTAAKQLLDMAKNRLNKFYNPKMYVAQPKVEEAELAQIQAHAQQKAAPPPPPQAPGAYSKKSEESNGVIAMIDSIIQDLDKEMTVCGSGKGRGGRACSDSSTFQIEDRRHMLPNLFGSGPSCLYRPSFSWWREPFRCGFTCERTKLVCRSEMFLVA